MTEKPLDATATVGITGTLVWHDAAGNIVGTTEMKLEQPFADLLRTSLEAVFKEEDGSGSDIRQ